MITTTPVEIPAAGVLTPALDFKAERENDPVDGYALKSVPRVLLTPMAINSWFGLILYPLRRPNDFAMEMCSRSKTMVDTAGAIRSVHAVMTVVSDRLTWQLRGKRAEQVRRDRRLTGVSETSGNVAKNVDPPLCRGYVLGDGIGRSGCDDC